MTSLDWPGSEKFGSVVSPALGLDWSSVRSRSGLAELK